MEMLSLREHHARTLLIHYRWDVERLVAVLVEKGKACLFAEAGVTVVEHQDLDSPLYSTNTCDICMEDVASDESTRVDCGHCFCNNCKHSGFCFHIFCFSAVCFESYIIFVICPELSHRFLHYV